MAVDESLIGQHFKVSDNDFSGTERLLWIPELKPTLHSEAHVQASSAGCIGSSAGVPSRIRGLNEGDLEGSWAEQPLPHRVTQQLPVFVPRDAGRRGAISVAVQHHCRIHRGHILLSLWSDDWRYWGTQMKAGSDRIVKKVETSVCLFLCCLHATYLALLVLSCPWLCLQGSEPHKCTSQSRTKTFWWSADFHRGVLWNLQLPQNHKKCYNNQFQVRMDPPAEERITCGWYVDALLLPGDSGSGWACGSAGQSDGGVEDHIQSGRMGLDHWEFWERAWRKES